MPKYSECSIYEEACRNGTCSHQNNPQGMSAEEYVNVEVTATMPFEAYAALAAFLVATKEQQTPELKKWLALIKFVRTR